MIRTSSSSIFFSAVFDVGQSRKLRMRKRNGSKDDNVLAAAILILAMTTMRRLTDSSHSLRRTWIGPSVHGMMRRPSMRMGTQSSSWTIDSLIFWNSWFAIALHSFWYYFFPTFSFCRLLVYVVA
jgi:hypothetical protein